MMKPSIICLLSYHVIMIAQAVSLRPCVSWDCMLGTVACGAGCYAWVKGATESEKAKKTQMLREQLTERLKRERLASSSSSTQPMDVPFGSRFIQTSGPNKTLLVPGNSPSSSSSSSSSSGPPPAHGSRYYRTDRDGSLSSSSSPSKTPFLLQPRPLSVAEQIEQGALAYMYQDNAKKRAAAAPENYKKSVVEDNTTPKRGKITVELSGENAGVYREEGGLGFGQAATASSEVRIEPPGAVSEMRIEPAAEIPTESSRAKGATSSSAPAPVDAPFAGLFDEVPRRQVTQFQENPVLG